MIWAETSDCAHILSDTRESDGSITDLSFNHFILSFYKLHQTIKTELIKNCKTTNYTDNQTRKKNKKQQQQQQKHKSSSSILNQL